MPKGRVLETSGYKFVPKIEFSRNTHTHRHTVCRVKLNVAGFFSFSCMHST